MAALAVVIIALISLPLYRSVGHGPMDSIAVLPFVNVDGDPNIEYLSDGITESLISSLSQMPNFAVISRASVFRYKGRETDPQAVGRELKVKAVLIGRIIQRGENLFITTELVDASNNHHLWGQQYQRKLSDIFLVQEEISREISDKLRLRLSREEKKRLTKRYTQNAEAHQLYLKGRYFWNTRTEEALKKSIGYFEHAIKKDPSYALAHAALADSYGILAFTGWLPPREGILMANAAAMKALQLDDTLAEAHTMRAGYKAVYDWDWPGAEREFKRAIELDPSYATAHQGYSLFLAEMGRVEESLAEIKRAQELDPVSPVINIGVAWHYYWYTRRYDEAIKELEKALDLDPNFAMAHQALGWAYQQKGEFPKAIEELHKAITASGRKPNLLADLGCAYGRSGRKGEAMGILEELKALSQQRYVSPYDIAMVYTGRGEKDQAFEWLQRAYEERTGRLLFLKMEPRLDPLRSDPRFADLLRRVGLPP